MILYMISFTHTVIINIKEREVTASILCCIYHLFLYCWRRRLTPSWARQYRSSRRWLTMPACQARRVLFSRLSCWAKQPQFSELTIVEPPQRIATQLLLCVKRCQKVEGRVWSVTGKAWDTHEGEGSLQWQEPECVRVCVKWPWA